MFLPPCHQQQWCRPHNIGTSSTSLRTDLNYRCRNDENADKYLVLLLCLPTQSGYLSQTTRRIVASVNHLIDLGYELIIKLLVWCFCFVFWSSGPRRFIWKFPLYHVGSNVWFGHQSVKLGSVYTIYHSLSIQFKIKLLWNYCESRPTQKV